MAAPYAETVRRVEVRSLFGRLSCLLLDGDGPPVMLIHGNSSCAEAFAAQITALEAAGRAVVAPDLPGHGRSGNAHDPERRYSFPGYAAALGETLDALAIGRVDLVGWSLGGHVALELAGTDARVRSVLVTGTPPIRPSPAALAEAFRASPDMALAGKPVFDEADALAYASAMLGSPRLVSAPLLAAALRTDGRARDWMMRNGLAGVGIDETALLDHGAVPVAIVQGDGDPFLDMTYLAGLKGRNLWRGGVQWLEGLGHAPHVEAPERFNAAMFAFFADVEVDGAFATPVSTPRDARSAPASSRRGRPFRPRPSRPG